MLRKILKSKKGFTLVEVIVVAVIVLILAAVAIPLYNGYIRDSRTNVAENTAGSLASALAAAVQQEVAIPTGADQTGDITIPGLNGTNNIFRVPDGYTVDVDETQVICSFGDDISSQPYVYNVAAP